jgi:hypothetical protein
MRTLPPEDTPSGVQTRVTPDVFENEVIDASSSSGIEILKK